MVNLFQTKGIFQTATYNKVRMIYCMILKVHRLNMYFPKKEYRIFFSEDRFCLVQKQYLVRRYKACSNETIIHKQIGSAVAQW